MKLTKFTALVLAALLSAGMLVSCSGEKKDEANDNESSVEVTETTDTDESETDTNIDETENNSAAEDKAEPAVYDPNTDDNSFETLTFGMYEQDNDSSNGSEIIKWIVLEKQDGKALIMSKYGLDSIPYNVDSTPVTWESSDIRVWLNDSFLNTAFSEDEKSRIETKNISNNDNSVYKTDAGNATADKIFLLSLEEAGQYFSSDEERQCTPTAYAKEQGTWINKENGNCFWWLRSPGEATDNAALIFSNGTFGDRGNNVSREDYAVRPAMWITLEG